MANGPPHDILSQVMTLQVRNEATFRDMKTLWLEGGKIGAPLLVFLHGFPDGPDVWDSQYEYFKDQYHVICPFVRGSEGFEEKCNPERYRLDAICLDLLQMLTHLDPSNEQKIYLVGHDLGGPIAWRLSALLGARLEKLVIINSLSLEQMQMRLRSRPKQWLRSWYVYPMLVPKLPEAILSRYFAKLQKFAYHTGGLEESLRPKLYKKKQPTINSVNLYRAFVEEMTTQFNPKFTKLKVPTLILWGRRDPFLFPPSMDELEPFAKKLTVRILEGSHWVFREKPTEVNGLLKKFFEERETHADSI